MALVANFIGTEAVGAYTIVLLLTGLTEEFFGGFTLTSASLCSQAVGAKNYFQAGEYVQIGYVLFSLCMVPNFLIWFFLTDDLVKLVGFNDATAQMAQVYASFHILTLWVAGLDEGYGLLVCTIKHECYYTSLSITSKIVTTCILIVVVLTKPATLADVGSIELGMEVSFFGLNISITLCAGWLKDYTKGMFRTNALQNWDAVRTVFNTAVPLALGNFLSTESGKY